MSSPTDRRPTPDHRPATTVHLLEPGGRGGVYQHSVAVAEAVASTGRSVVLHTAADAEFTPGPSVEMCPCLDWQRSGPRPVRQIVTAARFLGRVLPHLHSAADIDDLLHVQGLFGTWLTEIAVRTSARRRPTVFSPHNLFARSGRARTAASIERSMRSADLVVGFSEADEAQIEALGAAGTLAPLVFAHPQPNPLATNRWKRRWGQGPAVGLFGQVRADKRPDVFVEACALLDVRPIIVGKDLGGLALARSAARAAGVELTAVEGYLPIGDFVDALASVDVVVSPQTVASTSGPLALAAELGIASVGMDVGGLSSTATIVAADHTPEALRDAIRDAMECSPQVADLDQHHVGATYVALYDRAKLLHMERRGVR